MAKSSATRACTARLVVSLLQPEGEGNVFGHGLLHQQIVTLEHHAHAPARRAQLRAGKGSDVLPASMICPEVGRSSSVKQRSSVDFPAPDMPMMP